jgi:hypothetical protein
MPMRDVIERSKLMRVGCHIVIRKLRAPMDYILFLGKENVLNESVLHPQTLKYFLEACFGFKLILYK